MPFETIVCIVKGEFVLEKAVLCCKRGIYIVKDNFVYYGRKICLPWKVDLFRKSIICIEGGVYAIKGNSLSYEVIIYRRRRTCTLRGGYVPKRRLFVVKDKQSPRAWFY